MRHAIKSTPTEETFGRTEKARLEKLQSFLADLRELLETMQEEHPEGGGWEKKIESKIQDATREIAELEILRIETEHGFNKPLDKV